MVDLKEKLLSLEEVQKLKEITSLPSKWCIYKTVYDHSLMVMSKAMMIYPFSKVFLVCAALHDVGKAITRRMDEGWVTFPGHADISKELSAPIIRELFEDNYINGQEAMDCSFIIEHHMRPMTGQVWSKKATEKFLEKFGEKTDMLMRFADLDIRGNSPMRNTSDPWTREIKLLVDAIENLNRSEQYACD